MKKFLNIFFVALGVIFFILILVGMYLFIVDPLNLKPLLFDAKSEVTETAGDNSDKHPALNEQQEAALETFGIDPATIPSQISPDQEACFVEKLGAERVSEIKAGAAPTATDFFTARNCLQ
jgi:hypothetical protein